MSKRKERKERKETYCAFYGDGTVKIGFCHNVMNRIRTLGGSSSCFAVFSTTHNSEREAIQSEKEIKKDLNKFLIKDAECQEWLHQKVWGFFPALQQSLGKRMPKGFKYALAVGQKTNTDWEPATPADIKKLVTGK